MAAHAWLLGALLGLVAAGGSPSDDRSAAGRPAGSAAAALRPRVRTLSRPIDAFHYTTRARLGLPAVVAVSPQHPNLKGYLSNRVSRFWNLDIPTAPYEMVGGLHLATDPVISRVFGGVGSEWALVQIPLPRGFRFLDVRSSGSPARAPRLPAAVASALAEHGCATAQADYLLTTLESRACRRLASDTLVALDVDGVLYDYPKIKYGECPERADGAFIVLRTTAFEMSEVKVFTSEPPPGLTLDDPLLIREAFLAARRAGSVRVPPWPELADRPPPSPFASWAARRLFGCGAHPEDDPVPEDDAAVIQFWRTLSAGRPQDPWPRFHLAEALVARGRTAEAIGEYGSALRIEPAFAEALQALAWIYATSDHPAERSPAEAVRLAERLVEIVYYRPLAGRAWSKQRMIEASLTLAAADAGAGNLERAVAYAVQALEASSREHDAAGNPLTARTVERSRRALDLFRSLSSQAHP